MEGDAEALSNPNLTSGKALDPTAAHRKHAAMLERLSNRKQYLSSKPSDSNPDSFESTQSFLSRFSQSKLSIDSDLARCLQHTGESNESAKPDLERISIAISDLEKFVAENSYFLPSYEVRTCLKTVSDLKQTLENVTSEVIPKKRFGFKNKKASTGFKKVIEPEIRALESGKPTHTIRFSPGFRGRENETLVKEFVGSEMGEFTLSDLNACEVRLTGCLRALFIHRLRNCKVYTGPVSGSVLIEQVECCVFVLASHQIRIHHARESCFYLRVRSRPIIEDCNGVRFAPYCFSYDGIERDLRELNLEEETGNWANVDDFRWLRAVQSPNWSILPENERGGIVHIWELDK